MVRARFIDDARADDRTAAGATTDAHDPLRLEQAQRLAQRLATDAVLLDHLRLERQPVARLQAVFDDVPHDREGDHLRRLPHRTWHPGASSRSAALAAPPVRRLVIPDTSPRPGPIPTRP